MRSTFVSVRLFLNFLARTLHQISITEGPESHNGNGHQDYRAASTSLKVEGEPDWDILTLSIHAE